MILIAVLIITLILILVTMGTEGLVDLMGAGLCFLASCLLVGGAMWFYFTYFAKAGGI